MIGKDILLALLTIMIWALNMVFNKIALLELDPNAFTTFRLCLYIPFMLLCRPRYVSIGPVVLIALFWNVLNFLLFAYGIKSGVNVNTASIVFQSCALFSVIFSYCILKDKPTALQMIGVFISFVGLLLISLIRESLYSTGKISYILAAAASWGIGSTLLKKYSLKSNISLLIWIGGISGMLMLILNLFQGNLEHLPTEAMKLTPRTILCILFSTVFSTGISGVIWSYLLNKYQAILVNPFMLLIPGFSSLFSYLILDESLSFYDFMAASIIALGLYINQRSIALKKTATSSY